MNSAWIGKWVVMGVCDGVGRYVRGRPQSYTLFIYWGCGTQKVEELSKTWFTTKLKMNCLCFIFDQKMAWFRSSYQWTRATEFQIRYVSDTAVRSTIFVTCTLILSASLVHSTFLPRKDYISGFSYFSKNNSGCLLTLYPVSLPLNDCNLG